MALRGTVSSSLAQTGSFGSVMQNGKHFPQVNTVGENIAFGTSAGSANVGGNVNKINIAIGSNAGTAMADKGGNVYIGRNAAKLRTTGDDNICIGTSAGGIDGDTIGHRNVLVGLNTGLNLNSQHSGTNVFIGYQSGHSSLQSISNVFIGQQAGHTLTNSSRNVAIGTFAGTGFGVTATTTENSIYIGQYARTSVANANNEIVIGSEATGHGTDTITFGDKQITDVHFASGSAIGATFHGVKDFAGNISSSITSTGSFGQVNAAGNVGVGIKNLAITDPSGGSRIVHIHKEGSDSAAVLRLTTGDTGTGLTDGLVLEYWDGAAYLWNYENTNITFATNNEEVMTITNDGNLNLDGNISASGIITCHNRLDAINGTNFNQRSNQSSILNVYRQGGGTANGVAHFVNSEGTINDGDFILKLEFDDEPDITSTTDFITFHDQNGEVGSINAEVVYSTFTGAHVSQRPSGSSYADWKPGMIVKSTGNILATGSSMGVAWPEVELTTAQKDKAVMGVWEANNPSGSHRDKYLDRSLPRINYNAVGEGRIRVTDTNGNIETGDYICSSVRTGHGEKQDEVYLANFTVAKATQPYNFTSASNDADLEYKSVLIACTYHCG